MSFSLNLNILQKVVLFKFHFICSIILLNTIGHRPDRHILVWLFKSSKKIDSNRNAVFLSVVPCRDTSCGNPKHEPTWNSLSRSRTTLVSVPRVFFSLFMVSSSRSTDSSVQTLFALTFAHMMERLMTTLPRAWLDENILLHSPRLMLNVPLTRLVTISGAESEHSIAPIPSSVLLPNIIFKTWYALVLVGFDSKGWVFKN